MTRPKTTKTPWPTKAVMDQIYEMKLWGGHEFDFYSGLGSHLPTIIDPYVSVVKTFLKSFNNTLTICDLGCGDFNIGKELVPFTKAYSAVDIVEKLIERNRIKFKADNLNFECLDIAKDQLPKADCILLRQVLQHLSNAEVQKVVCKLNNYKYVILTEHIPKGSFVPNKDIISGQGIRLKKQSGLDLLAPPFDFKVKHKTQLLKFELEHNKGIIETILYEVF